MCGCSAGPSALRRGGDVYPGLAALKAANVEGRDYSTEAYDRGARATVFAVHGGDIEFGTARLARLTADKDLNLYIFNGWLGADSARLHITSTRFDDPAAVRLATASVLGISFHAQADRSSYVCVGGKNAAAARLVAIKLEGAGFAAEMPCPRLPGTSDKNITNLPSAGGVQLELTLRLLRRLERDPAESARFVRALRSAIFESIAKTTQENIPR
ncbi:MAG: hypothetical protein A2234_08525 [Elusimicrobia bacterium RIFOXYA2_FULL_58_8]|nr:MAG: hypothetical protein A2234_08525 [Elusimicrobia bacterium RIFOXYA2_FULL_58_8]OGS12839.1 MAG: hypothetical protein A2285_03125 [Elusimicrobia bacterium RIFOXYA12_FULL_57_11]